ncbi:ty1-copia retrotransposon protein [Cucumis melo var. makuwa]|uniref:Ty1-copia retrotransposon protein n=1 Tax=Cucumis melo var. makuwa TaxID=1194695 RepID=A0A5D3DBK5_CUCMM|nr:ty1-copia retrotransposon protein [Cucumis melo var. makuwa]TYK21021.1 ty1-copia retrotransposon protein [Cucumis melo var. makuwa]
MERTIVVGPQKLLIFFKQLEVDYVLTTDLSSSDPPATTSTSSDPESSTGPPATAAVTDQSTLESRYGGDDAGRKKYVVGKWLQFQMTDDKSIVEQIHEYENLVANVLSEGMKMCEILQANVLLKKSPPSWNDYRNHLKHKKKDLKLQELISHICTEEANRLKDKKKGHKSYQSNQRKGRPSQKPTPQANLAEQDSEIIAAIVEANLIKYKTNWILDTGASRHFCTNRELLHDYKDTVDG